MTLRLSPASRLSPACRLSRRTSPAPTPRLASALTAPRRAPRPQGLAFCQPTEAGRALAVSYVGEERLLVYASAEDASRDASDSATGKT